MPARSTRRALLRSAPAALLGTLAAGSATAGRIGGRTGGRTGDPASATDSATPGVAWSRSYGGGRHEEVVDLAVTADGGVLLVGTANEGDGDSAWLVKTDERGQELWSRTYSESEYDGVGGVVATPDGGGVVGGTAQHFREGTGRDPWLLGVAADGTEQWRRVHRESGSDTVESMIATADGGYLLAGWADDDRTDDGWLAAVDGRSGVRWQRSFGGARDDALRAAAPAADGGYVLAGFSDSTPERSTDAWLVAVNGDGSVRWNRRYGGTGWEWLRDVAATPAGGFLAVGNTDSARDRGNDPFALLVDDAGNEIWRRHYPGEGHDATAVLPMDDGFLLAAETGSDANTRLLFLDRWGRPTRRLTVGSHRLRYVERMVRSPDGGVLLAGTTESSADVGEGSLDGWLAKLRPG